MRIKDKHFKDIIFLLRENRNNNSTERKAYDSVLLDIVKYLNRYIGCTTNSGNYTIQGFNVRNYYIQYILINNTSKNIIEISIMNVSVEMD